MKKSCCCLCLFGLVLFLAPSLPARAAEKTKNTPLDCSKIITADGHIKVDDITTGAGDALACEWKDPGTVQNVLAALDLLTSGAPVPFNTTIDVLCELRDPIVVNQKPVCPVTPGLPPFIPGVPYYDGLYRAAMGDPDADGIPQVQGLPDFVDTLAKANTLKLQKSKEDDLFGCTQLLMDAIFSSETGKLGLLAVNASFHGKANYLALDQLLHSFPAGGVTAGKIKFDYVHGLELFRAAFAMNTKQLAAQVEAKVTPAKE